MNESIRTELLQHLISTINDQVLSDFDGETWGVSDHNGDRTIVDCDGYPVNTGDSKHAHLPSALVVTEEMEQDF